MLYLRISIGVYDWSFYIDNINLLICLREGDSVWKIKVRVKLDL